MKKKTVLRIIAIFISVLWIILTVLAIADTDSKDIIGGADGSTFWNCLKKQFYSDYGTAVRLATACGIAAVFYIAFGKKENRKDNGNNNK